MKTGRRKGDVAAGKQGDRKKSAPEGTDEESCRCKEVSKKSIPELLKVAVTDLSFWKKKR